MCRLMLIINCIAIFMMINVANSQPLRSERSFRPAQQSAPVQTVQQSMTPVPVQMNIKSPAKAFLFSAVLPGAGELYAGKKRGLIFTALEVGALTSIVLYDRLGDRRKEDVIAFANAHWDSTRCLPNCVDPNVGTEQLGEFGSQQYYEQVGKYNKFQEGWDDYDPLNPGLSPNRQTYVAMRHEMNQAYKWSTWSLGLLLVNHAVSAIHAALIVKSQHRSNEPPQEARLRFLIAPTRIDGDISPSANVSLTF